MFERVRVDDPYPRHALIHLDKPVAVWIRVADLLPTHPPNWGRQTPIWVRSSGIEVGAIVSGELVAWVRDSCGALLGICSTVLTSANGRLTIELPQHLVPADAMIPAGDEANPPTNLEFDRALARRRRDGRGS